MTPTLRRAGAVVAVALVLAACSPTASPRPTDPMAIVRDGIRATAVLSSAHISARMAATIGPGGVNGQAAVSIEADVSLATRELAFRATTRFQAAGAPPAADHVQEARVTRDGVFNRIMETGRWSNVGPALPPSPTNAEVAAIVEGLVGHSSVTLAMAEAGPCTLGTCDHVIARITGAGMSEALGNLVGVPPQALFGAALPDFELHVFVDQATSVISDLQADLTVVDTGLRIQIAISRPGGPVDVGPPPAALIDGELGQPPGGGLATPAPELPPGGGTATAAPEQPVPAETGPAPEASPAP